MELLQLRYFQIAAKYQHMTKAAANLNISQPALSKTIARLEAELGVSLFYRKGKSIHLNDFGKVFLERVNGMFLEVNEGISQINDMSSLENGKIKLAMTLPHITPMFLSEFLNKHPNVKINHNQASSSEMQSKLEKAELDICISTSRIDSSNIEWIPLIDEEIFLSVPLNHRLANRKSIDLEEVAEEKFIGLQQGYGFRDITDQFCKEAGFTPNTTVELEESWAVQKLVELGNGIAFIPSLSILRDSAPNTHRIKITNPDCKRTIGMAWNKNHYLSQAAIEFREFTMTFFKNIVNSYYL
ncbi:LysR family transcriptional regulator [Peribacillus sp. NPDC097206]|uniref:LysR family transcriptional regulator n=1 Tax=unclassified Peribacillus TaxID=2675266 RepID=UPI0038209E68